MSRRGRPDPGRAAQLGRLQALARMKAEVELSRLAATGQSRARLQSALAALGEAQPPLTAGPSPNTGPTTEPTTGPGDDALPPAPVDPLLVRARLAHAGWIEAQRRELNARLAMVMADWHRLQPAAARAEGRARVLERLRDQARDAWRARKSP